MECMREIEMYNWKRWKGLAKGKQQCPKCHKWVDDSEYDDENDICYFCEFPETSPIKSAEMDYSYGYPKNKPLIDQMIEKADLLPEKQTSKKAIYRKIYKKKELPKEGKPKKKTRTKKRVYKKKTTKK